MAKPNARTPRGMPDRRGWFPTQEGSASFDGKSTARCTEKRSKPRQKKRNPRRSLALPVGLPFSFVLLFFWASKRKVQMLLKRYKCLIIKNKKRLNSIVIQCYCPFLSRKKDQKIKAVFKSYDFFEIYGGAKKTRPDCVGAQTVFRFSPLRFQKNRDLNKAGPNHAWRFSSQ